MQDWPLEQALPRPELAAPALAPMQLCESADRVLTPPAPPAAVREVVA